MADTTPTQYDGGRWEPASVERLQAVMPGYEIIELLGAGGMGAVYKARQRSLKRLVAIKILPTAGADDEFKFVERFRNEAETLAQMNHPAIVGVYDFGETPDGLLFFVMEFVDGTDVHKMIQTSGKLSSEHALSITAHVCDALAYAHRHGVIHRDIKPANILINREGHVKVADFGLAKMHDPSRTNGITMSNMAMGTPDFAAPEVFKSAASVDHRADLYAVGVMLYQMLTGDLPRGFFKLPSEYGGEIDPRFDQIIVKAMEANRDERFQSALEVRHALDEILTTPLAKNDGTGAISASAIPQRSRVTPKPQVTQPAPAPASSGKAKWLVAAAIVAVLGIAGFFVMSGKKKPSAASANPSVAAPTAVPSSTTGVDEAFLKQVAAANPPRQVELVVQKIEALYSGKIVAKPTISNGAVTGLNLTRQGGLGDEARFRDLSSIAALRSLKQLELFYLYPTDLSFLRGLQIEKLVVHGGKFPHDVLRDLPLTWVELRTADEDFSVLKGKRLTVLDLKATPANDLSFIKGMPLTKLTVDRTKIQDLSPIRGLPLKEIICDFVPERDAEILRSIPTLTRINEKPAAEFWAGVNAKAPPTAAAASKTVELLPLVDVQRDALAGEWSRDGAELLVKAAKSGASGSPRLQLPYQPPEEYDFEIEFTPESDGKQVTQILSAYQRPFTWQLDVKLSAGIKAGFTQIGGKSLFDTTDGTAMRPRFLTTGQRHRSTVEVRRTGLRGLLDGQQVVKWGAKPESYQSLDIHPNDALRDTLHLGLGGYDRVVRFHKITVREITGTGKVDAAPAAAPASPGASAESPPANIKWRDVTAEAREKANAALGFGVDAQGIHKAGGGPNPRLLLTPLGQRDQAVFVRYTGEAQVDLRFSDRGSIFVLAQVNQTIFQSWTHGGQPPVILIPNKLHPPDFDAARPHELLVTIEGTRLRAWLDGRFVGEAKADTFAEGATALVFLRQTVVHKVELADLTAGTSMDAGWQPVFTKPEDFGGDMKDVELRGGASFIKGRTVLASPTAPEGAIRASLRNFDSDRTGSLTIRSAEPARFGEEAYACTAFLAPGSSSVIVLLRDKSAGISEPKRTAFPVSPSVASGESFTFELRAERGQIVVKTNGQQVGTLADPWKSGLRRFGVTPSNTEVSEFRDVAVSLGASASANAPATAAPPVPPSASWQDLTPLVREKASGRAGLAVEPDAVRQTGGDEGVTMRLDGVEKRDRLVRVRYVGETQISLWPSAGSGGSAYVLVQRGRTVFRQQPTATSASVELRPDVPHPAGFDPAQPHELLVAVQGSTLRAWIDDRFLGEVDHPSIKDTQTGLNFAKGSAVQKVEVAELK